MPGAHLNNQTRTCGATTITSGQNFVKINGQAWAVVGDMNSHGGGAFIENGSFVKIGGKSVIVQNNQANPDNLCPTLGGQHCTPSAAEGSSFVSVG